MTGTSRTTEEARLLNEVELGLQAAERLAADALTAGTFDLNDALWGTAALIRKVLVCLRGIAA